MLQGKRQHVWPIVHSAQDRKAKHLVALNAEVSMSKNCDGRIFSNQRASNTIFAQISPKLAQMFPNLPEKTEIKA